MLCLSQTPEEVKTLEERDVIAIVPLSILLLALIKVHSSRGVKVSVFNSYTSHDE